MIMQIEGPMKTHGYISKLGQEIREAILKLRTKGEELTREEGDGECSRQRRCKRSTHLRHWTKSRNGWNMTVEVWEGDVSREVGRV